MPPNDDQPGFAAEEPEHCHACYRLIQPGQMYYLTMGQAVLCEGCTRECAEIFGGDECMACYAPEGWETVSFAHEAECPEGYTLIEDLEAECRAFKDEFYCSEGHSGVHGECEDLVVHKKRKQCAFVEDIHNTVLPEGWDKRREGLAPDRWFCPHNYDWVENLDTVPDVGLDSTPEVVEPKTGSGGASLPCLGAVLMVPAVLGLWLSRNRNR
jgi:hypothetical protein